MAELPIRRKPDPIYPGQWLSPFNDEVLRTDRSLRFLGSVAITAPITYYLLQQTPTDDGGHGHGHGEEHEEGGEHEDGDSDDNTEGDAGESEESSSDEDQATPDTSEDEESNEESETVRRANSDVNFKGPTEGGPAADERSHIPDAKGGAKLGISSAYGQKQGEGEQTGDESEGENLDKVDRLSPQHEMRTMGCSQYIV